MTPIFEDVLRSLLISTNLCGNRVYVMLAPQSPAPQPAQPYMVLAPTGPEPKHTHDGAVALLVRNYQVSIFDDSQSIVLGVGDSLAAMLDGFHGEYSGVQFAYIFFELQTTHQETETRLFQTITEWRICFRLLPTFTAVNAKATPGSKHERTLRT